MPKKSLSVVNDRSSNILVTLKKDGFRLTKVRKALIEILGQTISPLSAFELLELLKTYDLVVNKTTVYRELEFLLINKVILELDLLDGMKRYELIDEGHHHHLVCTLCRKIQCIGMKHDLDHLEQNISQQYSFQIESHVLEFFGRCLACQ